MERKNTSLAALLAITILFSSFLLANAGPNSLANSAADQFGQQIAQQEPVAEFTWTPAAARAGESIDYDGSASRPSDVTIGDINADGVVDSTDLSYMGMAWGSIEGDSNWNPLCDLTLDGIIDSTDLGALGMYWGTFGNYIATYDWWIDNVNIGAGPETTYSYATYSKTPHNITLQVTDSQGKSNTLTKNHLINRDVAVINIWPSMEGIQGTIQNEFIQGKRVAIGVNITNSGTIVEYTNNSKSDFPLDTEQDLWLVKSRSQPTETWTKLDKTTGKNIFHWRYAVGPTQDDWYYYHDWNPNVDTMKWYFWDTSAFAPEDNLYLYANFSQTFTGDTDTSNDFTWFGPFNLTQGYDHDIRLDGIWTYDPVSYVQACPPYPGTAFKYYYGPYPSGIIADVTVGLTNIGKNSETNIEVYVTIGSSAPSAAELPGGHKFVNLTIGEFTEISWSWDTTGYYGEYALYAHIVPLIGEIPDQWATWDNNVPGQAIPWWDSYDSWGISS